MNAQIRSILISSALLAATGGSFAAGADSEVGSLVRKTLSGQNVSYTHDAYIEQAAASRAGATDASTIVRQVLRGESTALPTVKRVADLPAADALAEPGTSESWRLIQRLLLGHAG